MQLHLVLNAAKLRNCDIVREENPAPLGKLQKSEPVAMDVDVFTNRKHSKDTGPKRAGVCKNCRKKGHRTRDCGGHGVGAET